ncbi:isochorismate synthase [Prevotella sp. MGM1]|nr:isochorismate synthase [Prevotella sp. MGM1]
MGPLAVGGDTHLYVSLRCMLMASGFCVLYAGGGLLKDSVEEMEWDETEAKMDTMRKVVDGKQ